jgi:hypothetical protein
MPVRPVIFKLNILVMIGCAELELGSKDDGCWFGFDGIRSPHVKGFSGFVVCQTINVFLIYSVVLMIIRNKQIRQARHLYFNYEYYKEPK